MSLSKNHTLLTLCVSSADPGRFYPWHPWQGLPPDRGQNVVWSCHPCQAVESRQAGFLAQLFLPSRSRFSYQEAWKYQIWSWSDVTLKGSRRFLDIFHNSSGYSLPPFQSFTLKVKINLAILHLVPWVPTFLNSPRSSNELWVRTNNEPSAGLPFIETGPGVEILVQTIYPKDIEMIELHVKSFFRMKLQYVKSQKISIIHTLLMYCMIVFNHVYDCNAGASRILN